MEKRGIAPIVATVLVILITVVAATLIAVFIIPFVKDNLNQGKACFDNLGALEIYHSDYNCYYENGNSEKRTGFSVGVNGEGLSGFRVVLIGSGTSDTITVQNGATNEKLRMIDGIFNDPLNFSESGGVRTYVYNGKATNVEIYPITETSDQCDLSDSIQIKGCINQEVITDLFSN